MTENTEKPSETLKDSKSIAARWIQELKLYEKEFKKWEKRADKIGAKYASEAKGSDDGDYEYSGGSGYNVFWSNINVLGPALYARMPVVQIERRHKDKDPLSRLASETWERATSYEAKNEDFNGIMNEVVLDYLITARGTARIRFEVELSKVIDPTSGMEIEQISKEAVPTQYVYSKDFRHQPARVWEEVQWVAFRSYLNKDELAERGFPEDLPLTHKPKGAEDSDDAERTSMFAKAVIWEIWDKGTKKVYWLCEGYDQLCDQKDDPYGLTGFFPCPKPLYGTRKRGSLNPVPDYDICAPQYRELDNLSVRIKLLTSALRVAGVYDASMTELDRLLGESTENRLIPVQNWSFLAEKGGIDGVISWLPIQQVAEVLVRLYDCRDRTLAEIYEITGLSDIVRGNSDANETATAQQIKGNFATLRLGARQQDVQRFARDLLAMKAEIIAEHFQPETIRQIGGYDQILEANLEDPTEFETIIQLLRSDPARTYRIDIETDSTIAVDEQQQKEKANEYLTAVGGFMQQVLMVAQQAPEFMPFMGETLKYTARQYRAGRALEGVLEQSIDQFTQAMQQPPPEAPPDPKMMEVQQQGQLAQAKMQLDQQKMTMDTQTKEQELQLKAEEIRLNAQLRMAELQSANTEPVKDLSEDAGEVGAVPVAPPVQPITLNINVTPGRKRVTLGPIDPLTGVRTGEVVEEPSEELPIAGV